VNVCINLVVLCVFLLSINRRLMPISSGANPWPKSYWKKPQPRVFRMSERATAPRRFTPRTVSLSSSTDGRPSNLQDNGGFQSGVVSPAASDAEPRAVRSPPAVVVPLPHTHHHHAGGHHHHYHHHLPGHSAETRFSNAETPYGTSMTRRTTVSAPAKRVWCATNVSPGLMPFVLSDCRIGCYSKTLR